MHLQLGRAIRAARGFDGNGAEALRAFLGGRLRDSGRFLHPVRRFYNEEDDESNNQEINYRIQEKTVIDGRRTGGFGGIQ